MTPSLPPKTLSFSFQRFSAFLIKETIQVFRDPSSILIAFVLPTLLIFLFGYGVSLDANIIRIGVVMEDTATEARSLAHAFSGTSYFSPTFSTSRPALIEQMMRSQLRGVIVIPQDFSERIRRRAPTSVQVIADGSETNTANFVQNYADGVLLTWVIGLQEERLNTTTALPISIETQTWFNSELKSRNVILPGSIAIIMSLIGTLLTALVVAREWERGTMEAILSTPIRISELILGKLAPYFFLGLLSMILCVSLVIILFMVPFRGSYFILFLATSLFLLGSLGQGLLISSVAKNQFVATQISLMLAFLPAFMLSGFLYEITSMPKAIQLFTYCLPPRYFVTIIQSLFLGGNIWSLIIPNLFYLLIIAAIFLLLTRFKVAKRL